MKSIIIDEKDNVGVALKELKEDSTVKINGFKIYVKEKIPVGHKFAIKNITAGNDIIKYGFPIGRARRDISIGEHVHIHNLQSSLLCNNQYYYNPKEYQTETKSTGLFFKGYKRSKNRYGIRNDLFIIPTVGCVVGTGEKIAHEFRESNDKTSNIDVYVLKHQFGCSQYGRDLKTTTNILENIAVHPNAGGVLILGLGCEFNSVDKIKEALAGDGSDRIRFLVAQEVEDEIKTGVNILKELFLKASAETKVVVPISELKIGLKCGGSDGFSGLTANPLLGAFSDFLVSAGGTTVISEIPEMFGAESVLFNRAVSREVFDKMEASTKKFKEYLKGYGQPIDINPSPGNISGGITTLEEKSLGCVQKGGKMPIEDVTKYTGIIKKRGLNILDSPSNDPVCTTALGSSGCHMVLFTTGRGTPFGSFIPTLKISTNTSLFELKRNWIDFNAGKILEGKTPENILEDLVKLVIRVSSGEKVLNEKNAFSEIAIWKIGATG